MGAISGLLRELLRRGSPSVHPDAVFQRPAIWRVTKNPNTWGQTPGVRILLSTVRRGGPEF